MKNKVLIFDNGGETCDRYTAVYLELNTNGRSFWHDYVGMSEDPFHPQGVGMHGELHPDHMNNLDHLGKRITFDELPEPCQRLIRQDLGE